MKTNRLQPPKPQRILFLLFVGPIFPILSFLFPAPGMSETITVVRGNGNYPPYETTENGRLKGIHIELTRAAAKALNIKVKYRSIPWKRAVHEIKLGKADAISYIRRNSDREKFLIYREENILSTTEVKFITTRENKDKIKFDGDAEALLARRTLITQHGFSYGKIINQKKIKKYPVDKLEQMIQLLKKKRYQVGIVNLQTFRDSYHGTEVINEIVALEPTFFKNNQFIAFSKKKKREDLAGRFAEAIAKLKKSPEYEKILRRYLK